MASGTTVANLKMIFSSDTTGLEKGAKTAKQSIKDFDSTVGGATDSLARMFGVDTAAIDKMTSSLRGMGETMKKSSNEGTASLGKMLSSINAVQAGIAGLGIAAATAAFKLLTAEADNFKQTVAGANIEMMTAAYVQTYTQTLHDLNVGTGKAVADVGAEVKKGLGAAWATIKTGALSMLTGGSGSLVGGIVSTLPGTVAANANAERAAEIAGNIYQIQRQISDEMVRQSDLSARIAQLRQDATDPLNSAAERQAAVNEATELIRQKYEGPNGLIALQTQLADAMEEMAGLTASTPEQIDAANQQRIKANEAARQEAQEIRSIQRTQASINSLVAQEAEARKKAADAVAAQVRAHEELLAKVAGVTSTDLSTSGNIAALLPKGITGPDGALEVKVRPVLDEDATLDLTNELVNLAASMSSAIGGLVGDLASGGDAWGNFKNAALSAFADMAISVGKLAMATGAATAGIKAALESLNPYVAIAAGAALIALGSAVKAGLSNAAAGNYAAAASPVATSSFSNRSPSDAWNTNALTVRVEGKLVADGDQLTAVINNTNNRNSHTT